MGKSFCFFIISLLLNINSVSLSSLEHDGALEIRLEDNLVLDESNSFRERGNISIQSIRIGQTTLNQEPLKPEESKILRDLALSNKYYQLKAKVNGREFISTVKACMIAEAELDDRISISLDYSGRVVAVSQIIASKSACEGALVNLEKIKYFTTNVYVRHSEMGPIPDTASYIQRLEREREAKERGEGKDNRSFLAKYWMYIVPVVIVMVISSAANPENTAPGGGGAAS